MFNCARDFVSYRRHHLKGDTIRLLVMLLAIDSFNAKESFRACEIAEDWEEAKAEEVDEDEDDEALNCGYISDIVEDSDSEEIATREIVTSIRTSEGMNSTNLSTNEGSRGTKRMSTPDLPNLPRDPVHPRGLTLATLISPSKRQSIESVRRSSRKGKERVQ